LQNTEARWKSTDEQEKTNAALPCDNVTKPFFPLAKKKDEVNKLDIDWNKQETGCYSEAFLVDEEGDDNQSKVTGAIHAIRRGAD
jgi:hypothetical protein